MKGDVFKLVREASEKEEWGKVFEITSKYLAEFEEDWGEKEEEVALLKIKSVIKSIPKELKQIPDGLMLKLMHAKLCLMTEASYLRLRLKSLAGR